MNTLHRRGLGLICAAALAVAASPSAAQVQRAFTPSTLRGAMVFGDYPQVRLNGRETQLSPGTRVRNQDNLIVMAGSLAGARMLVHYTLDAGGEQIGDVWILRPDEAAQRPWPTTLEEARAWTFDAETRTWIKP